MNLQPDAAALEALGTLLIKRAADLGYVGRKLQSNTWGIDWECAKADRYSAAMQAREKEIRRLASQMSELGDYLKKKSAQMGIPEDQAPRPDNE